MRNTKKTKENTEKAVVRPEAGLEPRRYVGRRTNLAGAAALVTSLRAQRPGDLTGIEEEAFAGVEAVGVEIVAALERRRAVVEVLEAVPRAKLVSSVAVVSSTLERFKRSGSKGLAEEAGTVSAAIFGSEPADLKRMVTRELVEEVGVQVRKLGEGSPLRKRLEALVPKDAVALMLSTHGEVAAVLGRTRKEEPETPDTRQLLIRAHAVINRYATVMVALARPDDPAAMARAKQALSPLAKRPPSRAKAPGTPAPRPAAPPRPAGDG